MLILYSEMREIVYQDRVSNRIIMRRQQPRVRDEV